MYYKTQRSFKDVETKEIFCLLMDDETKDFKLVSDGSEVFAKGTEVNGFYICAHTDVTIKINNSRQIKLNRGTFYNLKENEKITHKKFTGFSRFTKVK
jgi:uncharacterized membrane protein YfhO